MLTIEEHVMRTTRHVLCAVICVLALTACGGQQAAEDVVDTAGPSEPQATVASPARSEPQASDVDPVPSAPTSAGTASDPVDAGAAPPSGFEGSTDTIQTPGFPDAQAERVAYLTTVRAGRHPGFDRVVWTFDGPTPAYRVGYVERPITEDGSGRRVEVEGDAVLQIILTPASGTDLTGEELRQVYEGPRRITATRFGTTVVREIVETGDFEATLSWVVGVDRLAPFAVFELSNPTRVVVDIASG
jgi:hypothetical protein